MAEAVSEIKELRQQRRIRDRQVEELVQASNKLQAEAGRLEEQNLALRYLYVGIGMLGIHLILLTVCLHKGTQH